MITIFDCKIILKWSGSASDGTKVKGTLTIPEVSHEIICDKLSDFVVSKIRRPLSRRVTRERLLLMVSDGFDQYEWSLTTDPSPEVNALFTVAQLRLPKVLETKFSSFPSVIIDVHGKDLTVSADPSRSGTPAPGTSASVPVAAVASSSSSAPVAKPKPRAKNVNSATVVVEADFQASADDLFGLLTDAKRIPMWTRGPAEVRITVIVYQ